MYAPPPQRTGAALASLAIVAGLAGALMLGLRVSLAPRVLPALVAVALEPTAEPEPPKPRPRAVRPAPRSAPTGAPAPAGLRDRATPFVAPIVVPLIVPPPVVAATQAGTGQGLSNGASDDPGPGPGAGGVGDGRGGGGAGGEGDGEGVAVGPQQIRGKLSFRDIPASILGPGMEASVGVRYRVGIDGRVSGCFAERPSGLAGVDALACRLIERRFRFRPARNVQGVPVPAIVTETHSWFVQPEEPDGRGG